MSVGDVDYEILQSPGLLSSNAASGTTGAVLWKITPLVAEWLQQTDNFLFKHGILGSNSHVVELGCGISGLIALTARRRVGRYIATDLDYVLKGLRKNLVENGASASSEDSTAVNSKSKTGGSRKARQQRGPVTSGSTRGANDVLTLDLDWTTCTPSYLESNLPDKDAVDCVLACDCIYNEALVEPFVQTCAELCGLRGRPPVCIVAQQLRSDLVFEAWLRAFTRRFHTYRVPDGLLSPGLRSGSGYVIHVGLLRNASS